MIPYSSLDDEGSLLKPQPTIREVTNGIPCNVSNIKAALIFIGFILFIVILGHSIGLCPRYLEVVVTFNGTDLVHNTSKQFLSVALDTSLIQERWTHFNLSSPKFLQRSKVFSSGFLRIGGTTADKLIFKADSKEENETQMEGKPGPMDGGDSAFGESQFDGSISNFTMTGDDWVMINTFAKDAGLKLLFDLNVLLRQEEKWDSSNAKELIKFSDKHSFDVAWQLGNEPNSFSHVFHTNITGKQLGDDFISLREVLKSFPRYVNATLVGPDVTRPKLNTDPSVKYLTEFLKSGRKAINAVTWHQYYLNGHEASFEDFVNLQTFSLLPKQILAVKTVVDDVFNGTEKIPIWLSETGSAYGGGSPGLSNRFVAGYLWLDKLGMAAQMGIDVVVRQSLYHGSYGLLDQKTLKPMPDWWISVLYKTLVDHGVIQTSTDNGYIRIYCHCSPPNISLSPNGTMTLFGMNMLHETVKITTSGLLTPTPTSKVHSYILNGERGDRMSKNVALNGKRLKLEDDGSLPPFVPQLVDHDMMNMPPFSIGFFVMHGISVPACKSSLV